MKTKQKIFFWTVVFAAFCMKSAYSQTVSSVRKTVLSEHSKVILDQHLNEYTTFTMDRKELTAQLHKNGSVRFQIRIDEQLNWLIDLEANDMRAPGFLQTYTTDEGEFEHNEFVLNTFKGKTSEGQIVRFTIDENDFFGIILNDHYHYVIRQTKDYTQDSSDGSLIVYKNSDVIAQNENIDCIEDIMKLSNAVLEFSNDVENENMEQNIVNSSNSTCIPSIYYFAIATDADYEFYQSWNNSTATANNRIRSLLNKVEGLYEQTFNMKFVITYQHVWETPNGQPYISSYADTLNLESLAYWSAEKTTVPRNTVHLFTGKRLKVRMNGIEGRVDGISIPGAMYFTGHSGYSLSMDFPRNFDHHALVLAHEIGHDLGHNIHISDGDCSGTLMAAGGSAFRFCQRSIDLTKGKIESNRNVFSIIFGDEVICNTFTYTLNDNRLQATLPWSVTSGFTILSQSSTSVTVKANVLDGQTGTLSTTVNGVPVCRTIRACKPAISGPNSICAIQSFTLSNPNLQNITWNVTGNLTRVTAANVTPTQVKPTISNGQPGTLTATINGITISRTIQTCSIPISGPNKVCVTAEKFTLGNNQNATWSVSSGFAIEPHSAPTSSVWVRATSFDGQTGLLTATISNTTVATRYIDACDLYDEVLYRPNPDNCTTYFVFDNFEWYIEECPPGLYFCEELNACEWPDDSRCSYNCVKPRRSFIQRLFSSSQYLAPIMSNNASTAEIHPPFLSADYQPEEEQIKHEIILYPNPTRDIITIESTNQTERMVVIVYNSVGHIIHQTSNQTLPLDLNVEKLAAGTYFIRVFDQKANRVFSDKFVKL